MTAPGAPPGARVRVIQRHDAPPRLVRAARGLLAALVALALLLAGIAVGTVSAAAQNGVGASTPVMINTVGSSTDISAGQRLGKTVPQPEIVVATAVAAETSPLDIVPGDASVRTLTPSTSIKDGVEYQWQNEGGQTVRLRVHGPDSSAPAGSNAATGPVYRVQIGGRYAGSDGTVYPRGAFNPDSPNFDPAAANDTHIPWPSGIPLPWGN